MDSVDKTKSASQVHPGPLTGKVTVATLITHSLQTYFQPVYSPLQVSPLTTMMDKMLQTKGRREYTLVVQDGALMKLEANSSTPGATATPNHLSMRDAALRLRHSYTWLSRNWRRLGLKPRRLGRVLFFRSEDIDAMINRSEPQRTRGRRTKIVGVLNASS